jgi:hypothetical protein
MLAEGTWRNAAAGTTAAKAHTITAATGLIFRSALDVTEVSLKFARTAYS